MRGVLEQNERLLNDEKLSVDDYHTLRDLESTGSGDPSVIRHKLKLIEAYCDAQSTVEYLESIKRKASRMLQSGELSSGPATTIISNENFVDMGGDDMKMSHLGDPTNINIHTNLEMKKLLSRPRPYKALLWSRSGWVNNLSYVSCSNIRCCH